MKMNACYSVQPRRTVFCILLLLAVIAAPATAQTPVCQKDTIVIAESINAIVLGPATSILKPAYSDSSRKKSKVV